MTFDALDYRTNQPLRVEIKNGRIASISDSSIQPSPPYYVAPGLVDLQINGFKGVDFNSEPLEVAQLSAITQVLFEKGVITYFPTIITNSDQATEALIKSIVQACHQHPELDKSIGGIHLEGPFLSREEGPRGAHPLEFVKAPDWELFKRWQDLAEGRIKIITLSPEWPDADTFIRKCTDSGVIVSIGHTAATPEHIHKAITAGATMSTHLGNASHAMLPRHINYVWEQLASDALWSTLIADGFHLPDALLKIFLRTKPTKSLLVSDATSYADLPSGAYKGHIGGDVVLDPSGKLYMKGKPNMLAGSAQSLLWCVSQLVKKNLVSLPEAWDMASLKPIEAVYGKVSNGVEVGNAADLVIFTKEADQIKIIKTIKDGEVVFSAEDGNYDECE